VDSIVFKLFCIAIVLLSTVRVGLVTPFLDPSSYEFDVLKKINIATTIFFTI
jgi:hypothetical protein